MAEASALGHVIELCGQCGFDIPSDAHECPECGPTAERVPVLAARQVAGFALPTRSVRRVPGLHPRREPAAGPVPPAVGARTFFTYSWILVVVALIGALIAWVARLDRYVSSFPYGTAAFFDDLTVMATLGSVVGLGLGFVAMLVWCIRRVAIGITRHRARFS